MIGKYHMLERDIYKRMFNNTSTKLAIDSKPSSTGQEFIMTEKNSLAKARDTIQTKLKLANTTLYTLKFQLFINYL